MKQSPNKDLIAKLQALHLSHRREASQLWKRHRRAEQALLADLSSSLDSRQPSDRHLDSTGAPLAVGDIVKLRTSALTGKQGDLATVLSLKTRVSIRVHNTTTVTNRSPHNLTCV